MVEDSLAQDVLNKTSDQPVWPLGYADPAVTPWEPGFKTKTKIKKKKAETSVATRYKRHKLQNQYQQDKQINKQTNQQPQSPWLVGGFRT